MKVRVSVSLLKNIPKACDHEVKAASEVGGGAGGGSVENRG